MEHMLLRHLGTVLLVLSLGQPWSAPTQGSAPAQVVWSLDTIGRECPGFSDELGHPIAVTSCRVKEWDRFVDFEGETFYYVVYCVEDQFTAGLQVCTSGPGGGESNGRAIFAGRIGDRRVRLVRTEHSLIPGRMRRPSIMTSREGSVLELPLSIAGTCECNASSYYVWHPSTRTWWDLDWEGVNADVDYPAGLRNMDGFWPDLTRLTADGALWRKGDAHCCPTGGTVHLDLGISGTRIVVRAARFSPQPPQPAAAVKSPIHDRNGALSSSVLGTWITHDAADGTDVLDVLVLWRGESWSLGRFETAWELGASSTVTAKVGSTEIQMRFTPSVRSVQINGSPHWLAAGENVLLVDRADRAEGPVVIKALSADPNLPARAKAVPEAAQLGSIFRASSELQAFLRCAAPSGTGGDQPFSLLCPH
jgi:hypothetical protein